MFTTYSASAGSGKTTNLVADFIELCFRYDSAHLLQPQNKPQLDLYQKILGITFTNNASAEMKDRIVHTLEAFTFDPIDDYNGGTQAIYQMVVEKLFGPQPRFDRNTIHNFIQAESRELLRRIIFDYARFSISTIDSFFQQIIRASALTLNLNLNFNVEIEIEEFYLQAIDQLLNELSANSDLARNVIVMLDEGMEDEGKLDVDAELKKSLDILYKNAEKNIEFLDMLTNIDHEELRQWNKSQRDSSFAILNRLKADLQPIAQEGAKWVSELSGINFAIKKLNSWFQLITDDPFGNYVTGIEDFTDINGNLFKKSKFSLEEQQLIDAVLPHVVDCVQRAVAEMDRVRKTYLDLKLQTKNANNLLMLSDLKAKMDEIKTQNNFFILQENNILIYDTIKDKGFEVLFDRTKYDNFFIDEFQDTSRLQWEDMKPIIINNALSQYNRQVSLFGDVKQAIYRFRNGDSELFYNLLSYDRFQKDKDLKMVDKDHYRQVILDTNYRSKRAVVEFNNEFFSEYAKKRDLERYYLEGLKQKVHSDKAGLVQAIFYTSKQGKIFSRSSFAPGERFIKDIQDNDNIKVLDMEVLCAVKDALMRGYSEGDIAVLSRNNLLCSRLANLMLLQGWNVVTEKSLNLNSSPEVNLIINTMQYLLHPDDLLAQSTIVLHLAKIYHKDDLAYRCMIHLKEKGFFENLLLEEFNQPISRNKWIAKPLLLLVKDIVAYYGLDKGQSPFIVDFENMILRYLKTRNGELSKFLAWWQQQVVLKHTPSLSLPPGQNAITVSSIHKSKGLEYPVVILPYEEKSPKGVSIWARVDDRAVAYIDLDEKNSKGSSYEERFQEEIRNEEMDMLNVMYVAHTRARDMLYIITIVRKEELEGKDKKKEEEKPKYGKLLLDFTRGHGFEQDRDDAKYRYFGDRNWRKDDNKRVSVESSIVPRMVVSDFELDHVKVESLTRLAENDPRAEGNFVHDFLSKLQVFPQSPDEVEICMTDVEEEHRPRLRKVLDTILADERLRPCFASGVEVLNETTILDADGKEHRPDRVVFLSDKVVVIDYKTGNPHPVYQEQINTYCELLRNMGYENVEGRILYV
ncbi:MAG: UvrD-helicase domain-containing protein [Bacteroidales bacterium]|nr:UvrD-helicase domain-containing protein [Bacteroidales bacterium]